VRGWLRPLLLPLLRRREDEIELRSRSFRIASEDDRERVARLGRAFLGGYNAMLAASALEHVAAAGAAVEPHYRPFFFEGAAMGYLPRGYYGAGCSVERAEADLLRMHPAFRHLYYVGLGFWYGFRHRARPRRLSELVAHVDALYAPLCWDGLGFKAGFFDFDPPDGGPARAILEGCPEAVRPWAFQGFGRAMFFVYMDDPEGFERLAARLGPARRLDLEFGRSLARGFTGLDRPEALVAYVGSAPDATLGAQRRLGVTWALTARRMNDRDYFDRCLARAGAEVRDTLGALPDLCDAALAGARSYEQWQDRTRTALQASRWPAVDRVVPPRTT